MAISVETVNMFYICTADIMSEVIMNFIALSIIAEFDDIFFKSLPQETLFLQIDNKFVIKKTSSRRCKEGETVKMSPDIGRNRRAVEHIANDGLLTD